MNWEDRQAQLEIMVQEDRQAAIERAGALLDAEPLVFDTETTGLDDYAQICEIAVITHTGKVLVNTLVKPTVRISLEASRVHGITDEAVEDAPSLAVALEQADVLSLFERERVAIYNADYDLRMLRQSAAAAGRFDIIDLAMRMHFRAECVMNLYAEFWGAWHDYHQSYTFQSLGWAADQCELEWVGDAHRALADARMTLAVLRHMAETKD